MANSFAVTALTAADGVLYGFASTSGVTGLYVIDTTTGATTFSRNLDSAIHVGVDAVSAVATPEPGGWWLAAAALAVLLRKARSWQNS